MGRRAILLIAAVVIAALGGVLIFMYVQGVENRARAEQQPVQVLTAKVQINTGETVDAAQAAAKFQLTPVAKADVIPGALTSLDAIKGEVALTPIYPGEQILPNRFGATLPQVKRIDIPDGDVAISIQLGDPQRVAGFVSPGSDVAIFLSTSGAQGSGTTPDQGTTAGTTTAAQPTAPASAAAATQPEGDFTRILLPKVLVIAVGSTTTVPQTTTDKNGQQTTQQVSQTILTLGVSQDEAQKVIYAQGHGQLTLALLDSNSKVSPGPGADNSNLFLAAK